MWDQTSEGVTLLYRGGIYETVPAISVAGGYRDLNPDEAQQYLEGVDYPASKEDVAATAASNGAPNELVERIRALSTPGFSSADEVVSDLRAFPQSS